VEGGAPARERAAGVTGWGILIALLHHARQTVTVRGTMTKVIFVLHRREGVSREECSEQWSSERHTSLVRRAAQASWKRP
jgi:hypothetical protein